MDRKQTRDNWLGINYSDTEVTAQNGNVDPTFIPCNYDNECSGSCINSLAAPDIWRLEGTPHSTWPARDTSTFYSIPFPTAYNSDNNISENRAAGGSEGICQMKKNSNMKFLKDASLYADDGDMDEWDLLRSGQDSTLGQHISDLCKTGPLDYLGRGGENVGRTDYKCKY